MARRFHVSTGWSEFVATPLTLCTSTNFSTYDNLTLVNASLLTMWLKDTYFLPFHAQLQEPIAESPPTASLPICPIESPSLEHQTRSPLRTHACNHSRSCVRNLYVSGWGGLPAMNATGAFRFRIFPQTYTTNHNMTERRE